MYTQRKMACSVFGMKEARVDDNVAGGNRLVVLVKVNSWESRPAIKVGSESCCRVVNCCNSGSKVEFWGDQTLSWTGTKFCSFWSTMVAIKVARSARLDAVLLGTPPSQSPSCLMLSSPAWILILSGGWLSGLSWATLLLGSQGVGKVFWQLIYKSQSFSCKTEIRMECRLVIASHSINWSHDPVIGKLFCAKKKMFCASKRHTTLLVSPVNSTTC